MSILAHTAQSMMIQKAGGFRSKFSCRIDPIDLSQLAPQTANGKPIDLIFFA
jgi:hypothetical protein